MARQLLQLGADPNAKCRVAYQSLMVVKAMTPLHFAVTACAAHHEEMVALLIGAHADVNALMEGGCTPLMAAAFINLDGVNALLAVDGLEVSRASGGLRWPRVTLGGPGCHLDACLTCR